jgi:hypothetical protein
MIKSGAAFSRPSIPSRWRGIGQSCAFFVTLVFLALAIPATTLGQAQLEIQLTFLPCSPPLVEVQPGVRVVRDLDEEIFFANGRYWVRRDDRWYSTRNPRGRRGPEQGPARGRSIGCLSPSN